MTRVRPGRDPLRVGLVGYGLGGAAFHAPFIATTPGLELSAIVTRDPERQRRVAHDYPTARVVTDARDLWAARTDLDVVVISTPNRTHVALALAAINAGLHVVVDKPLAPSAHEARTVADAARAQGVLVVPFQNRRWDGDFLTLRRLVADGAVGTVVRFESRFERWRPTPTGSWRERGAQEDAGGLLFDLGSHLIDQALMLFGPARQVYAQVDRRRPGVDADDDAFVALTHVSGTRSYLYMSAVAAQAAPRFRVLGMAGAFTKWGLDVQEDALRAGTRPGSPSWGVEAAEWWGTLGTGNDTRRIPTERGDYGAYYAGLAAAVRGDGPAPVDVADAIATLDVIEAAHESAANMRVVAR